MALTPQKQLNYFLDRFTEEQISEDYLRLYEDSSNFCCAFAWLHEHYNNAFEFMTIKRRTVLKAISTPTPVGN